MALAAGYNINTRTHVPTRHDTRRLAASGSTRKSLLTVLLWCNTRVWKGCYMQPCYETTTGTNTIHQHDISRKWSDDVCTASITHGGTAMKALWTSYSTTYTTANTCSECAPQTLKTNKDSGVHYCIVGKLYRLGHNADAVGYGRRRKRRNGGNR